MPYDSRSARGRREKKDKRRLWAKKRIVAEEQRLSDTELLERRLEQVPEMSIQRLPEVINLARPLINVAFQERVVRTCLRRILSYNQKTTREPRDEQVRCLRRLIYTESDVLLIARTGFGKSVIFHAYTMLTDKITLQLIPLTRLGNEQLEEIRRFPGAVPCLVNTKTKREEKDLLNRIAQGHFTHVLLGPEQASSRAFRDMLKDPTFQQRIGLVAIDECHLVKQWEQFRPAFTLLGQLRTILYQNICWFGCSATLDEESEQRVLQIAGFRAPGNHQHQTEVIRTSIDRPDISICVIPIPRGKLMSWDPLYFLLSSAVSTGVATPHQIPKTIVFIDGRGSIHSAAAWAMDALMKMSDQYGMCPSLNAMCVSDIIKVYTATTAEFDRDATYNEFQSLQSTTRIVFATTSLGMGINIADVARVVTWRLPITKTLGDIWQRIGRGGRGPGFTSTAFVMLPYWLFDCEGYYGKANTTSGTDITRGSSPNRGRRQSSAPLPVGQDYTPSQLSQCISTGIVEDDALDLLGEDIVLYEASQDQVASSQELPRWRKAEVDARGAPLIKPFMVIANGSCHRDGFLRELGEYKLPQSERVAVEKSLCCSACNPSLLPAIIFPPTLPPPLRYPKKNTHLWFICNLLDAFAVERANEIYGSSDTRFYLPIGLYLGEQCRLSLANICVAEYRRPVDGSPPSAAFSTVAGICERVPALLTWHLLPVEGDRLLTAIPGIMDQALTAFMRHSGESRRLKEAQRRRNSTSTISIAAVASPIASPADIYRLRDKEIAVQVAQSKEYSQQLQPPTLILPPLGKRGKKTSRTIQPLRTPLKELRLASLNQVQETVALTSAKVAPLVFTPQSSRGRNRKLTDKGKENYKEI